MPGYKVAVLGPRRLGMSIVAALVGYKTKVPNFEITVIGKFLKEKNLRLGRHQHLLDLCATIGADRVINTENTVPETRYYDIVFDTTGSESGFELALSLTKKGNFASTFVTASFAFKIDMWHLCIWCGAFHSISGGRRCYSAIF